MTPTSMDKQHPALALKLRRGAKQAAGLEIRDAASGKVVALIPEGEQAAVVEHLLLGAPDLLWGIVRAAAHLSCAEAAAETREPPTAETCRLCKLLRQAFELATKFPRRK